MVLHVFLTSNKLIAAADCAIRTGFKKFKLKIEMKSIRVTCFTFNSVILFWFKLFCLAIVSGKQNSFLKIAKHISRYQKKIFLRNKVAETL